MNKNKLNNKQKIEHVNYKFKDCLPQILNLYYTQNISLHKISKIIGISFGALNDRLKKAGHTKRIGTRKHFCNENYFKQIDSPDKAYFLGLMYADGNNYLLKINVYLHFV